jgi:hypothetical protein
MSMYLDVFDRVRIYDMLFFNTKSVLEFPTLELMEEINKPMFNRWKYLAKRKHGFDMDCKYDPETANELYKNEGVYYPEFSKIVAITHANLYIEDSRLKRNFNKIVSVDEMVVVEAFIRKLKEISTEAVQSTPNSFPILVGHNIIGYDIPLLIKRYLYLTRDNQKDSSKIKTDDDVIPLILKRAMMIKPWDSGVIDTTNLWKFNGYDNMPLMLIADFLELKKTVDILPLNELNQYYWDNVEENPNKTIEYIALQSATQTNLTIQLLNKLRTY